MLFYVFEDVNKKCKYLLHLAAKNVTANELQQLNNKQTNEQKYIQKDYIH